MIKLQLISHAGHKNCLKLSSPKLELIATLDVGPRILHFSLKGGPNQLLIQKHEPENPENQWRPYGGHRFWIAPEKKPYPPDNDPVSHKKIPGGLRLIQKPERLSGLVKEIDLIPHPRLASVRLIHRLRNPGKRARQASLWPITLLPSGGKLIAPLNGRFRDRRRRHWPSNALVLWPYTRLADPRWSLGREFVMLKADPENWWPQKLGLNIAKGWIAYARAGMLFVKFFDAKKGDFPDRGSNVELFTQGRFIESETLSPLQALAPGKKLEHEETWCLIRGVKAPRNDAEILKSIVPRIAKMTQLKEPS